MVNPNLKDISSVPELTALEGTEKVLLNVDGSARQAAVGLIKPAEEWDLDLSVIITWNSETNAQNEPTFTAADGYSYDEFTAKLEAGNIPKVRISSDIAFSVEVTGKIWEIHPTVTASDGYYVVCARIGADILPIMLLPNGTFGLAMN